MARDSEKKEFLLNRLVEERRKASFAPMSKRPYLASQVTILHEAEKWRLEVIYEIAQYMGEIQNGNLGELKIRQLNDTINKLLREKYHWEKQIYKLNGANYLLQSKTLKQEDDGNNTI